MRELTFSLLYSLSDFGLEPDCIWRSSLFGISLASFNGKFLRVPD
jgi:hypothetical protein